MPFAPSGTKRIASVGRSSSAALSATGPIAVHVTPPSIENCQAPLPASVPTIAMPCSAPLSTDTIELPMNDATACPPLAMSVSASVASTGETGTSTGASATALTAIEAVSVPMLNALVPPPRLASARLPAVPLAWSQAR